MTPFIFFLSIHLFSIYISVFSLSIHYTHLFYTHLSVFSFVSSFRWFFLFCLLTSFVLSLHPTRHFLLFFFHFFQHSFYSFHPPISLSLQFYFHLVVVSPSFPFHPPSHIIFSIYSNHKSYYLFSLVPLPSNISFHLFLYSSITFLHFLHRFFRSSPILAPSVHRFPPSFPPFLPSLPGYRTPLPEKLSPYLEIHHLGKK